MFFRYTTSQNKNPSIPTLQIIPSKFLVLRQMEELKKGVFTEPV